MGNAPNWQNQVVMLLKNEKGTLLNRRRDDWDSSWVQSIHNVQFRKQVEWELEAQEDSDVVFIYFVPGYKAPISLLELGLSAARVKFSKAYGLVAIKRPKVIVCCPEGFWRKGNVDIVCARENVEQVESVEEFCERMKLFQGVNP